MADFAELLPIGRKFGGLGRTISEGDFTLLTNLTWTMADIHSNREYMKTTQFGDMILAGPITLALTIGLTIHGPFGQLFEERGMRIVALLGIDEARFPASVRPGDTLFGQAEILEARATSKNPRRGVVRIRDTATNQRGEVVADSIRSLMVELVE